MKFSMEIEMYFKLISRVVRFSKSVLVNIKIFHMYNDILDAQNVTEFLLTIR